jgi:HEAT repeat protein
MAQLSALDWRARAYAAWGLGIAGDTRATLPIRNALRDPVWRVRVHAAYAAGALRDAGAAPALIKLLKESRWQVRAAAAENLGLLGARSAIGALKDAATRDRHPAVQDAAETALRQLRD